MTSKLIYLRLKKLKKHIEEKPFVSGHSRLGAMILDKNGKLISIGFNSYEKTHPLMLNFIKTLEDGSKKIYVHAEIDCMNKGNSHEKSWKIMIIARIDSKNNLRLAKPCNGCYQLIKDKFDSIYYTNNKGELILLKGD